MPRLIAAYRWELLLVAGYSCSFAAPVALAAVARAPWDWIVVAGWLAAPPIFIGALYFRMRRFGHGLEFALLAVIPAVAGLANLIVRIAIPYFQYFITWFWDSGALYFIALIKLPFPVVTAALLAVGYRYARRSQREFTRLAWTMLLAVALVDLAIAALEVGPYVRLHVELFGYPPSRDGYLISEPLTMLLVLWFARRASRISLAHAFFIAALAFSLPLSRLFETATLQGAAETSLPVLESAAVNGAWAALSISATLAAVCMLGEFDRRGAAFRKRAAAALFGTRAALGVGGAAVAASQGVAGIAPDAPLAVGVIVGWGATLALVYLVRERRPVAAGRDVAAPGAMEG